MQRLLAHGETRSRGNQVLGQATDVDHLVGDVVHELHHQLSVTPLRKEYVDIVHEGASALALGATIDPRSLAVGALASAHAVAARAGLTLVVHHARTHAVAPGALIATTTVAARALHVTATETLVALLHILRVRHLHVHRLLREHGGDIDSHFPRQRSATVVGRIDLAVSAQREDYAIALVGTALVTRRSLLHEALPHAVVRVHRIDARNAHLGGGLLSPAAIGIDQTLKRHAQIVLAHVRGCNLSGANHVALYPSQREQKATSLLDSGRSKHHVGSVGRSHVITLLITLPEGGLRQSEEE